MLGTTTATYITVARTTTGQTWVLFPPDQDPLEGVQLLEDARHRLQCNGQCKDCQG